MSAPCPPARPEPRASISARTPPVTRFPACSSTESPPAAGPASCSPTASPPCRCRAAPACRSTTDGSQVVPSAVKLSVIEGGLGQVPVQPPVLGPAIAADRRVEDRRVVRWPAVALLIASLAVHAALVVAVMDLTIWEEPTAAGGTN